MLLFQDNSLQENKDLSISLNSSPPQDLEYTSIDRKKSNLNFMNMDLAHRFNYYFPEENSAKFEIINQKKRQRKNRGTITYQKRIWLI